MENSTLAKSSRRLVEAKQSSSFALGGTLLALIPAATSLTLSVIFGIDGTSKALNTALSVALVSCTALAFFGQKLYLTDKIYKSERIEVLKSRKEYIMEKADIKKDEGNSYYSIHISKDLAIDLTNTVIAQGGGYNIRLL